MAQDVTVERITTDEQNKSGKSSRKEDACAGTSRQSLDGGWGWFCVLGSFLNHFIIGGIERSGGLLYLELEERFDGHTASAISWIFSLNTALRQSLGPFVGILCNKFSCRTVVIAGGVITCVGLVLSAFPPVLPYMYFSYGILTGIGVALAYAPSVVIVGFYFMKYRGKAVGMSVSGVGVGCFAIPPITEALLSYYGYFGTLLILAGMGLNLTVGGALFRPISENQSNSRDNAGPTVDSQLTQELQIFPQTGKPTEETESLIDTDLEFKANKHVKTNDTVDTNNHATESRDTTTTSCWQTFLKKYLDVSLLLDIPFLSFCIAIFLFSFAFQASMVFLPALATDRGVPKEQTAILLSVIGCTEAISRILAGVLFDRPRILPVRLFIYNFDVALAALVTFLCTVVRTFPSFLVIGACYGLVTGLYISQKSVVIVDLVGQEVLNSSFGLLIWFQGMGSLLGPPIAGALKDVYQRYDEAFYFGGAVTLFASVIMLVGNFIAFKKRKISKLALKSSNI